jgi:predicted acetyltransferase
MNVRIIKPSLAELSAYKEALDKGWSPDNMSSEQRRVADLAKIASDPEAFLDSFEDPDGKCEAITLPDGTHVPRLPGIGRWIWDGEFCGHIGFRWQKVTPDLPPTCLGHIGYSVVPWKQKRGYATAALKLMLEEARKRLPYIEITTEPDNIASRRVIEANGGLLIEQFKKPASMGGTDTLRFRINLAPV